MGTTDYGPLRDSDELELLGELLSRSFGTTGEAQVSRDWASEHGPDGPRVLREDGVLAACLIRLPMGHFFGGRSVSTLGIAGVGVPAERRGEGHAKRLMTECLQEARREGFALSSLYASTFGLYRHLGYERAGNRFIVKVDPRHLVAQPADASMRPLGPDDEALVRSLYADYAKLGSGLLDRSDDIWRRVKNPARKPANGAVVLEEGQVTGYLRWVQVDSRTGEQPFDLVVSDHAASTPGAARRMLNFLASHGTMAEQVVWFGGPGEPLLALLGTTEFELKHKADWLIRFVDVKQALEARGYPVGLTAELHLEVEDGLFDENCGRFVLQVAQGRGTLEPGGDGRLETSVRGLAPLYTGHATAAQLRLTGWLTADDEACAQSQAMFAGPVPWMPDFF